MKLLSKTSNPPSFRGEFLGLIGLYDIAYGLHYLTVLVPQAVPFGGSNFWGYAFIVVGLVIFIGSFRKRDREYFALATFMTTLWAMEFFWLSVTVPWSWIQGITWLLLSLIVIRVAALSDPVIVEIIDRPDIGGSNDRD